MPSQQERLERIAEKLKKASGVNFRVKIVRPTSRKTLYAGAYVLLGIICVTSDVLDLLDDNEIAWILGHEITHMVSPLKNYSLFYGHFFYWTRFFSPDRSRLIRELLHIEELYCDLVGMQIARKAGFDPGGAIRVLYIDAELYRSFGYDYNFPTHPSFGRRIEALSKLV